KSRTASGARQIAGRLFIPLQVGLALVLVVLASCFSQTLNRLRTENTGFDVDRVTIQTAPFHVLKLDAEAKLVLYQRMVDRLESLPGVASAAVTWFTPMTGYQATAAFHALTDKPTAVEDSQMSFNQVGPGYFRTMSTSILDGRAFERQDRKRDVCILNQAAAAYFFGREQAIGRFVTSSDKTAFPEGLGCRVIGVAENAKFSSLREPPPRTIYFPVTPPVVGTNRNLVFLINAPNKMTAMAAYRTAARELAPGLPMVGFFTLREQMDAALGSDRAITLMSNFFSAVALFLSAVGLYGLLSASVAQRRAEIGVRMALGARRSTVLWMILSDGLRLLAAGGALGLLGLAASARFVEGLLYGVSPFEPLRLAAIAGVLIVVTLVSGLIPASRACMTDPIRALRAD
ncbi:MAG: FtsX-like permease family protein, partial [Bryobacteraceae bacterium]